MPEETTDRDSERWSPLAWVLPAAMALFFQPMVLILIYQQVISDFLADKSIVQLVFALVFGIPFTLFLIGVAMFVIYGVGAVVVGVAGKWRITRDLATFGSLVGGLAVAAISVAIIINLFSGTTSQGEEGPGADGYLASVPAAFERFLEGKELCAVSRDQACLTQVVRELRDDIGLEVPATASWMSDAHYRLYEALDQLLATHERSERGERSGRLVADSLAVGDELTAALDEWLQQASR